MNQASVSLKIASIVSLSIKITSYTLSSFGFKIVCHVWHGRAFKVSAQVSGCQHRLDMGRRCEWVVSTNTTHTLFPSYNHWRSEWVDFWTSLTRDNSVFRINFVHGCVFGTHSVFDNYGWNVFDADRVLAWIWWFIKRKHYWGWGAGCTRDRRRGGLHAWDRLGGLETEGGESRGNLNRYD